MRKLFLPILAGALLTACIDKDYDLENVDTDNIAIGGDDSKFEVPLARVLVTLEDIANGDLNILELCEKADKWLPSKLPGTPISSISSSSPGIPTPTSFSTPSSQKCSRAQPNSM